MNYHEVSSLKNFENMPRNPTSTTDLDALLRKQFDGGAFTSQGLDTVITETVKQRANIKKQENLQKLQAPLSLLVEAKKITQYLDRYLTGSYLEEKTTLNINRVDKAKNSIEQKTTEINTALNDAKSALDAMPEKNARKNPWTSKDARLQRIEKEQKIIEINALMEKKGILKENLALTKAISGVVEKHLDRIHVDMANKQAYQLRVSTNFDNLANWLGRRQITDSGLDKHIKDVHNGKNYWMSAPEKAFSFDMNTLFLEGPIPKPENCSKFDEQMGHAYSAERGLGSATLDTRKTLLNEQYWPTGPRNWGPIEQAVIPSTEITEKQTYVGHLQETTRERADTIANTLRLRPDIKNVRQDEKIANYLDFVTKTPSEIFEKLNARRSMHKLEEHEKNYLRDAENERDLRLVKNAGNAIVIEVFKNKQGDPNHANRLENMRVDEELCMKLQEKLDNTLRDLANNPLMEVNDLDSHIELAEISARLRKHKIAFHNDNIETANALQLGVHEFIHDRYFKDLSQGHFKSMEEAIRSWLNLAQSMGTTITNASVAFGGTGLANDALGRVIGNTLANAGLVPVATAAKIIAPH